jgi:hypothetical protein
VGKKGGAGRGGKRVDWGDDTVKIRMEGGRKSDIMPESNSNKQTRKKREKGCYVKLLYCCL